MSETTIIYSNTEFDKKVKAAKENAVRAVNIIQMIQNAREIQDEMLKNAMEFSWSPDLTSHYKRRASVMRKIIERLRNYLSVITPEVHL